MNRLVTRMSRLSAMQALTIRLYILLTVTPFSFSSSYIYRMKRQIRTRFSKKTRKFPAPVINRLNPSVFPLNMYAAASEKKITAVEKNIHFNRFQLFLSCPFISMITASTRQMNPQNISIVACVSSKFVIFICKPCSKPTFFRVNNSTICKRIRV